LTFSHLPAKLLSLPPPPDSNIISLTPHEGGLPEGMPHLRGPLSLSPASCEGSGEEGRVITVKKNAGGKTLPSSGKAMLLVVVEVEKRGEWSRVDFLMGRRLTSFCASILPFHPHGPFAFSLTSIRSHSAKEGHERARRSRKLTADDECPEPERKENAGVRG